jgi:Zn-dependent peptidase ImmA (M78 family)
MNRPPNTTRFRYCEQIAEDILILYQKKFGVDIEPPIDIEKLARDVCNLRVNVIDVSTVGQNLSGVLLASENQILVSDSDIPARNRFSIAHEIAHSAIERSQLEFNDGLTDDVENMADLIAGALLMPEAMVNEYLDSIQLITKDTIQGLAEVFQVSLHAMLVRVIYLDENQRKFGDRIDWISVNMLKMYLKEKNTETLKKKLNSKKENRETHFDHFEIRPVVETLDDYPEFLKVVIESMASKGIGVSFRSGQKENITVTAQTPPEKLGRPFFIELAGPPNAGKDTQSRILQEYFRNIRHYRVAEIQETYSRCAVEGLEHYQKYLWSLLETIKTLLFDRPSRFDVVIINRGIFDLLAMLNFHHLQKHCTLKDKKVITNFLLLSTWRETIDVVFMLPIDAENSIAREEEQQRRTVAALAQSFDPLSIPKPPQRIVNKTMLDQLSLSYQSAYEQYEKFFNRIYFLAENSSLSVEQTARSLIERIHGDLPTSGEFSLGETPVEGAIKRAKEKIESRQLPLL